ncbi:MAG: 16S rRNA (uracil(1498)-N(3))-methyltransferase [Desulfuromonas sp.]|nr:16S rRNA (uracil(1498)-N(3))-methyltransferase [Desulfuromonas sp.]
MNLILLHPGDYIAHNLVRLTDYRYRYVRDIHRSQIGDSLTVGNLSGMMGKAIVQELDESALVLEVDCTSAPPPPLPLILILALPRPKVLKRVLLTATTLGIKQIVVCNSWRVDKSYWSSPALSTAEVTAQMITGLEQSKDTLLPEVLFRNKFKPFVEDELAQLVADSCAFVAHPSAELPCPQPLLAAANNAGKKSIAVAIGPEGGFIQYEVDKLRSVGFTPISFGERILRVETALSWLAGHL